MNRNALILLLACTAAAAGCVTTEVVDSGSGSVRPPPLPSRADKPVAEADADTMNARERARIVAEVTAYYRDLTARDWDALARHFWRGAVVTTIWEPEDGSERRVDFITVPEFIAQMDLGPDSTLIFEQRLASAEVQFEGSLAQVWAEYRVRFGEPGHARVWNDVDAFTLMKHVGLWKISSLALAPK